GTVGDRCSGAGNVCIPGPPLDCNKQCLTGECLPASGCVPRDATTVCDDGNACTADDHCTGTGNVCVGVPLTCTEPCETGTCDPRQGCVLKPESSPCEDGDLCTTGDRCRADGMCVPGDGKPTCEGPCLTGVCEPAVGRPGPAAACDGGDCSTQDSCQSPIGCMHEPVVGLDATGCCLTLVPLDCSVKKIQKKLAKQLRKANHALEAARTPSNNS